MDNLLHSGIYDYYYYINSNRCLCLQAVTKIVKEAEQLMIGNLLNLFYIFNYLPVAFLIHFSFRNKLKSIINRLTVTRLPVMGKINHH